MTWGLAPQFTWYTSLSDSVPELVFRERLCVLGSMVTLLTVLCMRVGAAAWVPLLTAVAVNVYVPAGAAVPELVAPSQEKLVSPEDCGVICMVRTSCPLASVTWIVTLLEPAGGATAPVTLPPAVSAAVLPSASTPWPIRLVPLSSCADCMEVARPLIELSMLFMPLTSLKEASSLSIWLGSAGCVGS